MPVYRYSTLRHRIAYRKITCRSYNAHLAASEFFNTIDVVAAALVEPSHVIAFPFAGAQSLFVERTAHIFIVTTVIAFRVTFRVAAFGFINVSQELRRSFAQSETVHVITSRTQRPNVKPDKAQTIYFG